MHDKQTLWFLKCLKRVFNPSSHLIIDWSFTWAPNCQQKSKEIGRHFSLSSHVYCCCQNREISLTFLCRWSISFLTCFAFSSINWAFSFICDLLVILVKFKKLLIIRQEAVYTNMITTMTFEDWYSTFLKNMGYFASVSLTIEEVS